MFGKSLFHVPKPSLRLGNQAVRAKVAVPAAAPSGADARHRHASPRAHPRFHAHPYAALVSQHQVAGRIADAPLLEHQGYTQASALIAEPWCRFL